MRIPKSYQLSVGTREGLCYRFFGFCEQVIFSQLVYSKDLLSIANLKTCWKMNLVLDFLSYTWYMFQCLFLFQIIETGAYIDSNFISLLCRMLAALLTSYKRARGSHQRRSSFPLVGITGWNCNKWLAKFFVAFSVLHCLLATSVLVWFLVMFFYAFVPPWRSLFSFIPYMQQCKDRWELMQFPDAFWSHNYIGMYGSEIWVECARTNDGAVTFLPI